MKDLTKVKWKVVDCTQHDCWCAIISTDEVDEDGEELYVVGAGSVPKPYAIHIVNLHNNEMAQQK